MTGEAKVNPAELVVRLPGQPERRSPCDASEPGAAATLAIRTVREAVGSISDIAAIGHRIVHGGSRFLESVRIDAAFEAELDHLTELAPLHNPPALKAIASARAEEPDIPQVAVFDTSFFANLPRSAAIYPDPLGLARRLRHPPVSDSTGSATPIARSRPPRSSAAILRPSKLVVCHLGNGCSAAASWAARPSAQRWGSPPWPA